jgi:hypothetical protein
VIERSFFFPTQLQYLTGDNPDVFVVLPKPVLETAGGFHYQLA